MRACVRHNILHAHYKRSCFNLFLAGYNMALKRSTSQSETLWSYGSDLAVDGDPNTCSFTPQSDVQRWWQVSLGLSHV